MTTDAAFPGEGAPEGVEALDHTADVGIQVEAPDLPTLFRRAAIGALWTALGRIPGETGDTRELELTADGLDGLLRSWVRELLYWQEVEGFAAAEAEIVELEGDRIVARIRGGAAPDHPLREIKGVTWHGLVVEPRDGRWCARVIFDV